MKYSITPTSLSWVRSMYREMIEYYKENMGSRSKYSEGRVKITPRLLDMIVKRYNQISMNKITLNGVAKNGG